MYAAALPANQREIVETLRKLVLDAAPSARESIKWAQVVFEDHGPFAYIKAHRAHVTFGFWRGREIDGGRGGLQSSGSKMAHVRLNWVAEIDRQLLLSFVRDAVMLNRSKGDPTKTR